MRLNRRISKFTSILLVLTLVFLNSAPKIATAAPSNHAQPPGKVSPQAFRNKNVKHVSEIKSMRTQHDTYYINDDGSYTVEVSPGSSHYKDSQGVWQNISNDIVTSTEPGFAYQNSANSFYTDFADNTGSNSLVKFKIDQNHYLTWSLLNANKVSAVKNANSVTYPNILQNTDLQYQPFSDGLKENIVLNQATTTNTFQFDLNAKGLELAQQKDGSINVNDAKSGQLMYVLPKPYMYDNNQQMSTAVTISVEQSARPDDYTITLKPDSSWLNDPARTYPVTIDPEVTTTTWKQDIGANGNDTYVASNSPYEYYNNTYMETGDDQSLGYSNSYVKFAQLPTIPTGAIVTDAVLSLYAYDNHDTSSKQIDVGRVTSSWDSTKLTWSNQPPADEGTTTQAGIAKIPGSYTGWIDFNVWSIVKGWLNNGLANYGFRIRDDNESDSPTFYRTSNYTSNDPTLSVTYITDQTGLNPFWSYANVSDGSVNTFNGNFISSVTDFSLPGSGIPISVTRTYNSRGNLSGLFGQKWVSNLDEHLEFNNLGAVFIDSVGTERPFIVQSDGSYIAPSNYPMKLFKNNDGTYSLQQAVDNSDITTIPGSGPQNNLPTLVFNSSGQLIQLNDGKGNITKIDRSQSGVLTVSDRSGRVVTLVLNSDNTVNQIKDNQGKIKVSYTYNNGYLTSVTYAGDANYKSTTVNYDWLNGLLNGFTDKSGTKTYLSYNSNNQITSVGTQNMIPNPSLEQNSLNWIAGNYSSVTKDTSYHLYGSASLKQTTTSNTNTTQNNFADINQPVIKILPNTTYTFSAYVNVPTPISNGGTAQLRVIQWASNSSNSTDEISDNIIAQSDNVTAGWQRISGTFTTSSNAVRIIPRLQLNQSGTVYWDGIQLEQASSATAFLGHTDFAYGTDTLNSETYSTCWITGPAGEQVEYYHDNYGNPAAIVKAPNDSKLKNETDFEWNLQDELTKLTTPTGTYQYTYDAVGDMKTAVDPLGNTTSFDYYSNELKQLTMPDGNKVTNVWNPVNLEATTSTDAENNSTAYTYDSAGNVTSKSNVLGPADNLLANTSFEEPTEADFSRASTAYNQDGSTVAANQPRFTPTTSGQSLLIEEGTTNLLSQNAATIETNTSGWPQYNQVAYSRDTSQHWQGGASLKETASVSGDDFVSTGSFSASPNTTYTYSAYVYVPTALTNGGKAYLRVIQWDANNAPTDNGGPGVNVTSGWQRLTWTFTTKSTTTKLEMRLDLNTPGTAYWDGIQLEQKESPTSFTDSSRANENVNLPVNVLNPQAGTVEFNVLVDKNVDTAQSSWKMAFAVVGNGNNEINQIRFGKYSDSTLWHAKFTDGEGNSWLPTFPMGDGWHNVALTWDKYTDTAIVYIDGSPVATNNKAPLPDNFTDSVNNSIQIGNWQNNSHYLDTSIDNLCISSYAREASDIEADATSVDGMPSIEQTTEKLNFDGTLLPGAGTTNTIDQIVYDSSAPFGGGNVLHINPGDNFYTARESSYIPVTANTSYSLSGYLKALSEQPIGSDGACLEIYWYDANYNQIGHGRYFNVENSTWLPYNVSLKSPNGAAYTKVGAAAFGQYDAFFDDIQLTQSSAFSAYNYLENSSFSQGQNNWTSSDGNGSVVTDSNPCPESSNDNSEARILLSSTGSSFLASQQVINVQQGQTYTLLGSIKPGTDFKAGSNGGANLHLLEYNKEGSLVSDVDTHEIDSVSPPSGSTAPGWTKQVLPFTATTSGTLQVRLEVNNASGSVYFDCLRLSPGGLATSTTYNDKDNYVVSTTNQMGNTTTQENDNYGQVTSITSPGGEKNQYTYDGQEQLRTVTDNANDTTTYNLDANGNVLDASLTTGSTIYDHSSFTYDPIGNLLSEADGDKNVTNYAYDEEGRLSKTSNPNGTSVSLGYDSVGNVQQMQLSSGSNYTYGYDSSGRITSAQVSSGSTIQSQYSFGYDADNNLTSYVEENGNGDIIDQVNNMKYSKNSQLTDFNASYGTSNVPYSYKYTANGSVSSITVDGNSTGFNYDDGNNLISRVNPNYTEDFYRYNEANQVISSETDSNINNATSGSNLTPMWSSNYSYNSDGMLTQVVGNGPGSPNETFTYNNGTEKLDRLTNANETVGNTNYSFNYSYDPAGNILSMTLPSGNTITQESLTYDTDNRITTPGFEYDQNGNLTKAVLNGKNYQYVYDSANRLTTVKDGNGEVLVTYTYDGDGNPLTETANNVTTYFHYLNGMLLYETMSSDPANVIHALYVRSPQGDLEAVRLYQNGVYNYYYYHYDAQGNVNVVTDSSGSVYRQYFYDPYGNMIQELDGNYEPVDINNDPGFNNAYTYMGYRYDTASGLYFLKARYYAAGIVRFLTKDSFKGDVSDTGSLNRYAYCAGDPVNFSDPSGDKYIGNDDNEWATVTQTQTQTTTTVHYKSGKVNRTSTPTQKQKSSPQQSTSPAITVLSNLANYGSSVASTLTGMVSANAAKAGQVVLSSKAWDYSFGIAVAGWAVTTALLVKDPANSEHLPAILTVHTLMTGVAFVGGALAVGVIGTLALPDIAIVGLAVGATIGVGMLAGAIENAWIDKIRR